MRTGWDPIDELDEAEDMPTWACVIFVILVAVGSLTFIL